MHCDKSISSSRVGSGAGLYLVVDGDAVGPADAGVDQDGPLRAVLARALDARVLSPLRPEQVAARRQ